jgi:hypothetical protein
MRLRELIEELQAVYVDHGDIDVRSFDAQGKLLPIDPPSVEHLVKGSKGRIWSAPLNEADRGKKFLLI